MPFDFEKQIIPFLIREQVIDVEMKLANEDNDLVQPNQTIKREVFQNAVGIKMLGLP